MNTTEDEGLTQPTARNRLCGSRFAVGGGRDALVVVGERWEPTGTRAIGSRQRLLLGHQPPLYGIVILDELAFEVDYDLVNCARE